MEKLKFVQGRSALAVAFGACCVLFGAVQAFETH